MVPWKRSLLAMRPPVDALVLSITILQLVISGENTRRNQFTLDFKTLEHTQKRIDQPDDD